METALTWRKPKVEPPEKYRYYIVCWLDDEGGGCWGYARWTGGMPDYYWQTDAGSIVTRPTFYATPDLPKEALDADDADVV